MEVKEEDRMDAVAVAAIAGRLDAAWRTGVPIAPISESDGVGDVATAYAIQSRWTQMRLARGDKIAGRKIGLTSKAIQQQLGVNEPDYGALWQESYYPAVGGRVEIPARDFLQPRLEGEVAFLIGKRLAGPGLSATDVLAATDACALGVEIVASRIADWKIKLVDTIADNASYGGFMHGPWDRKLRNEDLAALELTIEHNGAPAGRGTGAAVLGNPAASTAWLANKLGEFGVALEAGDVVISGAITKMLPVQAGDRFVISLTGQPQLTVSFS
jgi:2-keto-4-pentenoate hydratase